MGAELSRQPKMVDNRCFLINCLLSSEIGDLADGSEDASSAALDPRAVGVNAIIGRQLRCKSIGAFLKTWMMVQCFLCTRASWDN